MKKISFLIVLSLILLCFSCKKDPIDVNSGQIIITENETPRLNNNNDTISAIFQGQYSYSGKIQMLYLQIGMKNDLSDASIYDAQISGHSFTISVDTMLMDTSYYYRYVVRRYSNEFQKDIELTIIIFQIVI